MKKSRKLLIVGCGRSGTKYISELLKAHGFDVGHEEDGKDGIASWPMTEAEGISPWGPSFSEYEFESIVHQVRNPMKVISSCHTITNKSWDYIKKYIPIHPGDSKLIMCAKYWYYWNLKAEKMSEFTYCIEDIKGKLPIIFSLLGGRFMSENALKSVPRHTNSRSHDFMPLKNIRRENEELYNCIIGLAAKYGYKKEE